MDHCNSLVRRRLRHLVMQRDDCFHVDVVGLRVSHHSGGKLEKSVASQDWAHNSNEVIDVGADRVAQVIRTSADPDARSRRNGAGRNDTRLCSKPGSDMRCRVTRAELRRSGPLDQRAREEC